MKTTKARGISALTLASAAMKRKPRTHLARKAATLNMTLETAAKPADTGHTSGPLETLETVYLCQLVRHESFGVKKSCFSIWHED
ncbi:hypothetical protein AM587_10003089 [Phytophthora nicotianae]|uniref:Uncharacterized protein n=1 Tax=Phytophthora nicotianae TaxID=4792 RepID=A0A0W8CHS2_PHYNI|nr:hypothetical protein AM587_10003089 [Phytophthora nicotianae]